MDPAAAGSGSRPTGDATLNVASLVIGLANQRTSYAAVPEPVSTGTVQVRTTVCESSAAAARSVTAPGGVVSDGSSTAASFNAATASMRP